MSEPVVTPAASRDPPPEAPPPDPRRDALNADAARLLAALAAAEAERDRYRDRSRRCAEAARLAQHRAERLRGELGEVVRRAGRVV